MQRLYPIVFQGKQANGVSGVSHRLLTLVFAAFFGFGFLASTVSAQQPGNPTTQSGVTPPRGVYVIANARIVTVSGPEIENGSIVIRDGKIVAVGSSVTAPAGAVTINARGLSVYPGMIDAGTAMGLVEISQGASGTVDTAEVGDLNPNAKAIIAVNPHSAHIGVTRVDGVTSAVSLPSGGLISGQGALINLLGTSPAEMSVVPQAALVINYPRTSAGGGAFGGADPQTNLTEALATATARSNRFARCCAMAKPTVARRMHMQRTSLCRDPRRMWCSRHSFLTCAASGR